ncbi:hypothetical protein CLIB1423_09S01750 [[Candida] railenensis]|uniref:Uncharacterized protein n=1 Tax=[Candida] railenensis TaxID=45579 RepID=A0A9P0QQG5_9ASCO|nr:hypothetical protein CLIB1423_09S01750 [[Candida] railenensis]
MLFERNFDPQTYWLDPVLRSRGTIGNAGINFEFAAFMVDAHSKRDELSERIRNEVLPQLVEHYRPFFEAYPFLSEPKPVQLEKLGETGFYFHGEISCPDGIDADLLYGLLYEFSLKFESLFIHVAGHILSAFDSETILPDEDLEISMNRFWLNQGNILYISPSVFHPGEDILLEDSLDFMQHNAHQCVQYGSVFRKGEESVYLKNALEGVVDVPEVRIPRALASVYMRYPWLISASFMTYYSNSSLREDGEERDQRTSHDRSSVSNEEEFITLQVGLPDWIATFVDQQADESLASILMAGFDKLLRKSTKLVEEYKNLKRVSGSESIELTRIRLQNKLISQGRLDKLIPPKKYAFDEKESDINDNVISGDQEKLMAQMTEFLKDEDKVRNLFEKDDQDEDGEDDDQDEREAAAEYFEKEGVDIDEDDFFEFFLRNALKVEKKDLSNYVAGPSSTNIERKRVYNNDSDYTSDEAEFPASYKDVEDSEEEYDSDDLDVQDSFVNMRTR